MQELRTDTDHLHELISARHAIIESLLVLTRTQAESSASEDVSATLNLLAQKEALVDQLRLIQSQLSIYRQELPDERVWSQSGGRQKCQELLDRSDELLRLILEIDGQTLQSMQQQREAVADQLKHGQDSMSARQAYNARQELTESQYLDISGL